MAKDSFKVKKSLNIEPKSSPTLDAEGDVGFNATSHKLEIRDNSTTKSVVTEDGSATLTNKTIDGASNTLSNIPSTALDLASGTAINVATTNTNSAVNIGTGTGTNTINIGGANTTINMTGTVNSQNVTNLEVSDKLITINNGGAAGSGAVAGIEIEEGGSATGYVATSADRNSWEFKAPNKTGIVSVTPPASGIDTVVLESATQTLSNKTIATPTITGTITASNLTADRAIATGSGGTITASATTSTELGYLSGVTSGVQSQLNSKANLFLSNLDANTTVNSTLKPLSAFTQHLGTSSYPWGNIYGANIYGTSDVTSFLFKVRENLIGSTKSVNINGPSSMASSYDLYLPGSQGAANSVLTNNGSGSLSWVAPTGDIGAAKGESLVLAASSPTLNSAAILQADSTSKGFLPPRMTQAQRDAIASPVAGLSIYNTDTNKLNVHNGTSWGEVGSAASSVVAASAGTSAAHTVNTNVFANINWPTATVDTNSAITVASGSLSTTTGNWSGNNWKYTCPIAGLYEIDAFVVWQPSTNAAGYNYSVDIYKNGTSYFGHTINGPDSVGTNNFPFSVVKRIVSCVAGDYLDVRAANNLSNTTTVTGVYLNIKRLGGVM